MYPGDLVCRRLRHVVDGRKIGIVVGHADNSCLVMWMLGRNIDFSWHIHKMLTVITDSGVKEVQARCHTA